MLTNESCEYELEAKLWISATANSEAPKLGEIVGTKTFKLISNRIEAPSLKALKMNKRIIHKEDLTKTGTIEFKYIPSSDAKVTIELQHKIGTAYQKVTDRLNQVNNTTEHNMGVFNINAIDGNNEVKFKLSSATVDGTYRLVFKVMNSKGIQLLEVPYNFLVSD